MSSGSWKHLWSTKSTITRWSRDSWQLASAMIRSVPRSSSAVRNVVVQYARRSNVAAVSLLQVDREVGLLRYWGVTGYLRQKHVGANWSWTRRWLQYPPTPPTTATSTNEQPSSMRGTHMSTLSPPTTTTTKARVAFMVTAAMRQELTERLAYSEEQIKRLTPLQASLVLHHDVPSHEVESKLPDLEQEHLEMQEAANVSAAMAAMQAQAPPPQQQQQDEQQQEQQYQPSNESIKHVEDATELVVHQNDDKQHDKGDNQEDGDDIGESEADSEIKKIEAADDDDATTTTTPPPQLTIPTTSYTSASGMAMEKLLPLGIPTEKSGIVFIDSIQDVDAAHASPEKIWFELIEHDSANRESAVVGLYRDVVEAQLALETRQLFERRRARDKDTPVTTSFVISRVLLYSSSSST